MIRTIWASLSLATALLFAAVAQPGMAATDIIPASVLIQPAQLAAELKTAPPTILQVGFSKLYQQAHIPGAIYAGPSNSEEGLAALKTAAEKLPRDAAIVIYCGCCPWNRCPNMDAAYATLKAMGFSKLRALYIADNFGKDWADKGYPVATGQ